MTGAALVLVSPLVATALGIPGSAFATMMVSLALGTLTLSWLGAIGAGLTVGLRRGNVLLSLIVLPLAMPLLIFGAGATDRAISGASASGALYLLAALCVFTCTLGAVCGNRGAADHAGIEAENQYVDMVLQARLAALRVRSGGGPDALVAGPGGADASATG